MATRRAKNAHDAPISAYEVHLGSWMRVPEEEHRWLTYREMARGWPITASKWDHARRADAGDRTSFRRSWGYQTVGYFAPPAATARHRT